MTKKMLIDATHGEETRVAVMDGDKLLEFDYESTYRKPLKGSIFLAKVTRVEPSLQAAFVNFGGNRHGFLPFSEIHPDYFKIPIADREALLAEQEEAAAAEEAEEEEEDAKRAAANNKKNAAHNEDESLEADQADILDNSKDIFDNVSDDEQEDLQENVAHNEDESDDHEPSGNVLEEEPSEEDDPNGNLTEESDDANQRKSNNHRRSRYPRRRTRRPSNAPRTEKYDDNEGGKRPRSRFNLRRKYKIQEVIKRGQIMLIQVSKEERGNKGAAVSAYLSLPGRYCVLMPNSPRAGGVSRKISNSKDRARMREIMRELKLPKGMSVILRTAGMTRTKTEIKRDLDYLMRLWDNIREDTLESSAPSLIYEEANLIKRAIRDIYTRDVNSIEVAGEEGYKIAKQFMKMMIPSHTKRVQLYKDGDNYPLFQRYRAEQQIADIGEVQVTLPSGGYLVINPTEALVSVDVNSGKSTKERHIEDTALRTNLEAADEVARQLRLRDLGGLVVIDFIDMENRRNNGKVERRMREALSTDRARVQMSRISNFGLMELSRQRMNPALTESQYEICSHCAGVGKVRTADALSLMVLRALEEEGVKARAAAIIIYVRGAVALYLLNYKRRRLSTIEERYGFKVEIRVDDKMSGSDYRLEVSRPLNEASDEQGEVIPQQASHQQENHQDDEKNEKASKSRRRGRRGGRRRNSSYDNDESRNEEGAANEDVVKDEKPVKDIEKNKKEEKEEKPQQDQQQQDQQKESSKKDEEKTDSVKEEKPKRGRKKKVDKPSDASKDEEPKEKKKPARKPSSKKVEEKLISNDDAPKTEAKVEKKPEPPKREPAEYEVVNAAPEKKKKGWWNKLTN